MKILKKFLICYLFFIPLVTALATTNQTLTTLQITIQTQSQAFSAGTMPGGIAVRITRTGKNKLVYTATLYNLANPTFRVSLPDGTYMLNAQSLNAQNQLIGQVFSKPIIVDHTKPMIEVPVGARVQIYSVKMRGEF